MNKEFVNYTQALALKELGFDEPCFAYFDRKDNQVLKFDICYETKDLACPTYSQAFRWFREKKNIYCTVMPSYTDNKSTKDKFIFEIAFDRKLKQYSKNWYYNTYEEAEQACLDKLIEIVKNK